METQVVNNKGSKSNKLLVLIVVLLLLVIVFGVGIVVGILVPKIFNVNFFETNQTNTTENINNEDNNTSNDQIIDEEGVDPCSATFTSSYLDLSFEYDSCNWEANEELTTPGAIYNVITMEYKDGSKVILSGNELGMGGGYSNCVNVSEYEFLTDDIARAKLVDTFNYVYWNAKNQFAFKGYNGSEHGDNDYNAFFEYLNPEFYGDKNACYVEAGVNKVKLLNPSPSLTEVWQKNKDLVITMESRNPTDKFLDDSDQLVLSVFDAI